MMNMPLGCSFPKEIAGKVIIILITKQMLLVI
jgi:hypothetical protein